MEDNLTILKREEEKYKGTLVLDFFDVVLFRGVILDQEDDYYYDLLKYAQEKSYWMSAVGQPIFLVDALTKKDYDYLVEVWNLNNTEKAK